MYSMGSSRHSSILDGQNYHHHSNSNRGNQYHSNGSAHRDQQQWTNHTPRGSLVSYSLQIRILCIVQCGHHMPVLSARSTFPWVSQPKIVVINTDIKHKPS